MLIILDCKRTGIPFYYTQQVFFSRFTVDVRETTSADYVMLPRLGFVFTLIKLSCTCIRIDDSAY